MGLEKHRVVRVAASLASDGGDRYRLGSGYLIADGLVLTAAHVLAGGDAEAKCLGGDWQAATVAWADAARDVAVLSCPGLRADGGVRWGRLTGTEPVAWGAVGFPMASAGDSAGYQPEHAWGQTSPISQSGAGQLALTVESREATAGDSPWAGLSGAAVFCGDHLVGVVTTDPGRYARSLVGQRVAGFCDDAGLTGLLGGRPALEDVREARQPVRAVGKLPRSGFLAGRDELLDDLEERLPGDGSGPRVVVLCGLGGVGKTSLAMEFAHRQAARLNVVWAFHAEEPTALAAGFGELAAQLGAADGHQDADPVARVHAILADYPAQWLLVFDNAPGPAAVASLLPPAGRGLVLITSRAPDWPIGEVVDVPVLGEEVAAGFLLRRVYPGEVAAPELEAAGQLADELGGLPLALEQAAAYIKATQRGIGGYLALFRKRRAGLLARGDTGAYGKQVATTWTLAFEELRQAQPEAVSLLRLLACYAPEAIPVRRLLRPRAGLEQALGPEMGPLLLPLADDELLADDAIAALRRYSLISFARDGLSVHRLVQAVTLDQLPTGEAGAWRAAAGVLIEAALPGERAQPGDWPVYGVLALRSRLPDAWPAYAALLPHAQAALPASSDAIADIASYLRESGNYPAARDLQREVLAARELAFGTEHPATLAARSDLAEFTGSAGDPSGARDQFTELVPVAERVLGPEHPHALFARSGRAHYTGASGNAVPARDQYAELLPVMGAVVGPEMPATLFARAALGEYSGRAGDTAEALRQFAVAVATFERTLGAEHPVTLSHKIGLAKWTGENGDAAAARDQHAALLPAFERIVGPEHPHTLAVRAHLARWTGEAQDWSLSAQTMERPADAAAARDQYAELLPTFERVFGPEHAQVLYIRFQMARWTGDAGDATAARDLYAALVPDFARVFGEESLETLIARGGLARWSGEATDGGPDHGQAVHDQYAALVPAFTRTLGEDHPETLIARAGLAEWTGKAGDPVAARDQYTAVVAACTRVLGEDHRQTLTARAGQAQWTGQAGDAAAARDQYIALRPAFTRAFGEDHTKTLTVHGLLARWTGVAGDPAAARDEHATLVTACARLLGEDHRQTLVLRAGLAQWTGQAGDAEGARAQYAAVVEACARVLGEEHRQTQIFRIALGRYTKQASDAATARDQYAALVPACTRVFGAEHIETLTTRRAAAHWTGETGDVAAARDAYIDLIATFVRVHGAEHKDTRLARAWLEKWAKAAGDAAAARDCFSRLLPVYEQFAGPEHPETLAIRERALGPRT